eukprot:scaffold6230_cov127-Isochrysis_galbana.AAC.1
MAGLAPRGARGRKRGQCQCAAQMPYMRTDARHVARGHVRALNLGHRNGIEDKAGPRGQDKGNTEGKGNLRRRERGGEEAR